MQGVQVSSAFNDENQTAHQHGPAVLKDAVLQTSKQQASVLKSTRKAFGNITNTQPREVTQQPETVKRRAFGDITYSVHKQQAANKSSLKPNIGTALTPSEIKPGPVTSLDTQQLSVPAWCATEPVERPAGKTWDQLQADRDAADDVEIDRSVQEMLAGFRSLASRAFKDMALLSTLDDDEIETDLLKPYPQPVEAATSSLTQASIMDDFNSACDNSMCLADLLPDIPLPLEDQPFNDSRISSSSSIESCSVQDDSNCSLHCSDNCNDSNLQQVTCTPQLITARPFYESVCSSPSSADNQGTLRSKSPEQFPW